MSLENSSNIKREIKGFSYRDIVNIEHTQGISERRYNTPFRRFLGKIQKFFSFLAQKILILRFIFDFFGYIFVRSRIIVTILSVVGELGSSYFDDVKKVMVNKLFWGRGKLFKFTAQFIGILLIVFVFVSYTYSIATVDAQEYSFTNVYASQTDLLVQGSSTNTQIPKDRVRMDAEKYIVKTGDTISSIASDYGLEIDSILWSNDLNEDSVIGPGDVLEIPPGNGLSVEVASGDTLDSLAEKYNANPQMIIDVNWLDYPFELKAGQEIFIPDGEKPAPPTTPAAPLYSGVVRGRPGDAVPKASAVDSSVGRFLGWPVGGDSGRLVQCFSGWHNGVDVAASQGTDIIASAPGRVTFAGCQSGGCPPLGSLYGGWGLAWTVIVDHGNGYSTVYGHLSTLAVSSGQNVSAGQPLGKVGATGTAYGLHVHYMLVRGGGWNAINPAPYMRNSVCGY